MYARLRAAESLGRIGDARAVDPLIAVLSDACPEVSAAAAQALAGIGTAAVKQLLAGLRSPDQSVRRRAAQDLVSLLKNGKLDPKDRRRILAHKREILELHPF